MTNSERNGKYGKGRYQEERWWRFWTRVALPLITPALALAGVLIGAIVDDLTTEPGTRAEVLARINGENVKAYSELMHEVYLVMTEKDVALRGCDDAFARADKQFFKLDPFLPDEARQSVWQALRGLEQKCRTRALETGAAADTDDTSNAFSELTKILRQTLFHFEEQ